MAWPADPLPVTVEMYLGSSDGWVDITDYVFVRNGGITIRRGFPDEGTTPEPSSMTMTLDNRDGRFTPRNPESPYYGLIGRNTPVRVRVGGEIAGVPHLAIDPWSTAAQSTTPDNAALDITGDIDVRIDAAFDTWETGSTLAGKWGTTSDQRSWVFLVDASGNLSIAWSTDGTSGTVLSATSTVSAGLTNRERKALRVTLDVNNGSGGWTATFYTADTIDGPWVQLGSPVTTAGTTSIFSSSTWVELGWVFAFTTLKPSGKLYHFELRNGIGGTVVADPDFTAQDPGGYGQVRTFTDSAGRTWTLFPSLYIQDPGQRYIGEVSEWPPRWDVSEQDVYVPITAQGILRRLGQGKSPLRSPLTAALILESVFNRVAYWPMEDGAGTRSFASAFAGKPPMTFSGARPDSGENGVGPLLGSNRIPVLAATTRLSGTVAPYTNVFGANIAVRCIMDVPPTTGWSDNTPIIHINQTTSGTTVAAWEVRYKSGSGGDLEVRALDGDGSQLAASGTLDFNVDGKQLWLGFTVEQDGSDVDYTLYIRTIGDDGASVDETSVSSTFSNLTVTNASEVQIAPAGGLAELAIGQVIVSDASTFGDLLAASTSSASGLLAFAGELAGDRADRLADEAGVTLVHGGDFDETAAMGAQAIPSSFIDALTETHLADMALVSDALHTLGLLWRTRRSLYNQPIALTLDYDAGGEIAPDLEPIDDDQRVRNDITVKRKNGSSFRVVDSTSRMGTQDPPDGVGRYEEEVEVNLFSDSQLRHQAYWRLHLGTWDEPRFPRVTISLTALKLAGKDDLVAAVCGLEVGDRIRLKNLPKFAGTPGTVDLLVLGFQPETILHPTLWTVVLNCVPYGPYDVGEYANDDATAADEPSRYDTAGCETIDGLWLPGSSGAYASTPDTADADASGDISLRCACALTDWTGAASQTLIAKYQPTGNQRSFRLRVTTDGRLQITWSTDGTSTNEIFVPSTVAIPALDGQPVALRADLDVDNGSGQYTVTFFYGLGFTTLSGVPWAQLGDVVTGSTGPTTVFSSSADITIGVRDTEGLADLATGAIFAASITADGFVAATFTGRTTGTTSFSESGETWTVNGSARIYGPFAAGTDTSMLVHTTMGQPWTTAAGDLPMELRCSGAVLSITAVAPSGSQVQRLTVSSTVVNGVEKSIPVGSDISLANPAYYAL